MITTRPLYVLQCDRCEAEMTPNPPTDSEAEMLAWARRHGWLIRGDWAWHRACAQAEADPVTAINSDAQMVALAALSTEETTRAH